MEFLSNKYAFDMVVHIYTRTRICITFFVDRIVDYTLLSRIKFIVSLAFFFIFVLDETVKKWKCCTHVLSSFFLSFAVKTIFLLFTLFFLDNKVFRLCITKVNEKYAASSEFTSWHELTKKLPMHGNLVFFFSIYLRVYSFTRIFLRLSYNSFLTRHIIYEYF